MIIAAALAFLVSVFMTWAMRGYASRLNAIAQPDPHVGTHALPTPMLGGVGILAGAAAGLAWQHSAAAAIFLILILPLSFLGLAKDTLAKTLPPLPQIAVEVVAGGAIVVWLLGPAFALSWAGVAGTVFVVGLVNAINFLDVSDGLAGGVSALIFLSLTIALRQLVPNALSPLALVCACAVAGFLVWNLPKASIFMGDAGSFSIGGFMAVITLRAWYGGVPILGLLLICAVPLSEVVLTVAVRVAAGRSPFIGDASHLSLRLLDRGVPQWSMLTLYWGATAATCLLGSIIMLRGHV